MLLTLLLQGCASVTHLAPPSSVPEPVVASEAGAALLWLDEDFRSAERSPNKNTTIDLGEAQTKTFTTLFSALVADLTVVDNTPEQLASGQIMIRPRLREVQIAAPSETYLNVYEVWLKYSLQFYNDELELVDEWFMPAYGKTPDNFMLSRSKAMERATDTALRDAGAKLIIDFPRIPALGRWRLANSAKERP
ncbi:MAG: hypothetical protein ACN4EJ_00585 [Porticoccaceae bacterium]